MKHPLSVFARVTSVIAITLLGVTPGFAQGSISLSTDTLSESVAKSGREMFFHDMRPDPKDQDKLTKQITLPVNKLKEIMDLCAANKVPDITVFFMTIRGSDLAHFRNYNPGVPDADLMGKQMLVIRVPRQIFTAAMGAKNNHVHDNPFLAGLLASGFVAMNYLPEGQPAASGDLYLSFGTICPPPASCD
jgi:hypothetical protein